MLIIMKPLTKYYSLQPFYRLFVNFALVTLFLSSGQAMAAHFANANGAWNASIWLTNGCGGSTSAGAMPTAADDVTICSGKTVTGTPAMTAKSVTIDGIFTPGANTLTVLNNFTNNGVFNGAGSTVTFNDTGANASTVGGTAATVFDNLTIINCCAGLTLGNASFKTFTTTDETLTLTASTLVGGTITVGGGGGSLDGTVKFTNDTATHSITSSNGLNNVVLDLSNQTAARLITLNITGTTRKINNVILPSGATNVMTLAVGGGGLTGVVAVTGGTCTVDSLAYTPGATSTVAAGKNLVCTPNGGTTISAPIFSTKEKSVIFSEEVK